MVRSQPQYSKNRLLTPIQYVKGVGPKLAKLFEKKGILTVEDALYFLPRCYEDRSNLKKISELKAGRKETGLGRYCSRELLIIRRRKRESSRRWLGMGAVRSR